MKKPVQVLDSHLKLPLSWKDSRREAAQQLPINKKLSSIVKKASIKNVELLQKYTSVMQSDINNGYTEQY